MNTLIIACFICFNQQEQSESNEIDKLKEENVALQRKIERLEKENSKLLEQISRLEHELFQKAKEIKELSAILKQLTLSANMQNVNTANATTSSETSEGPSNPIKASVLSVNVTFKFAIINAGAEEGIKIGYIFDFYEDEKMQTKIASGEVSKLLPRSKCQVTIFDGDVSTIVANHVAIARRKLQFSAGRLEGKFLIKSVIDAGNEKNFIIAAGAKDNIEKGTRFFVLRDNKIIATLEAKSIEEQFTICTILTNEDTQEIREGDYVVMSHIYKKHEIVGQLIRISSNNGIYINVGLRHQAMVGQKYEVRRSGKKIGTIIISNVYSDYSICQPHELSSISEFKVDDFVELVN